MDMAIIATVCPMPLDIRSRSRAVPAAFPRMIPPWSAYRKRTRRISSWRVRSITVSIAPSVMHPWVACASPPRTADRQHAPGQDNPLRREGIILVMSPRPSPRDLRASDADRDRVLAMLGDAMSDGRLTADEHAERVQRAIAARTLGELAELTADLAVSSAQPVRLDGGKVIAGIFGPARRDGRWVVPENLSVTAMFGEVEIDFTQAILQVSRVQLYATVLGGELAVRTPPKNRRFRLFSRN